MSTQSIVTAVLLFGTSLTVLSIASLSQGATGTEQPSRNALQLHLRPDGVVDGMPVWFIFDLVNTTDHDILLPNPTIQCPDSFDGSVSLNVEFHPIRQGDSMGGGGCARDMFGDWPSILSRLQDWKTLRAGESMTPKGERGKFFYSDAKPGKYEFWQRMNLLLLKRSTSSCWSGQA